MWYLDCPISGLRMLTSSLATPYVAAFWLETMGLRECPFYDTLHHHKVGMGVGQIHIGAMYFGIRCHSSHSQ